MDITLAYSDMLLPPLLQQTSHTSETHYYPLTPSSRSRPVLIHSHASGPFLSSSSTSGAGKGFNITIYSSDEAQCSIAGVEVSLDWWGTLGRWGPRYAQAALAWGVGVCALVLYQAWEASDSATAISPSSPYMPSVELSLARFAAHSLPRLVPISFLVSLLPFPSAMWLGNAGEPSFGIIAPVLGVIVVGMVCVLWFVVAMSVNTAGWVLRKVGRITRYVVMLGSYPIYMSFKPLLLPRSDREKTWALGGALLFP